MRAFLCMLATGLLTASHASAQELRAIGPFAAICDDEQATGFGWQNDKWVRQNFSLERFVVRKLVDQLPGTSIDGTRNGCWSDDKPKEGPQDRVTGPVTRVAGCYVIARQGTEAIASWCVEAYALSQRAWKLEEIRCNGRFPPDFLFHPNGAFSYRSDPGMLQSFTGDDGAKNYRDSFVVAVGVCSTIS